MRFLGGKREKKLSRGKVVWNLLFLLAINTLLPDTPRNS
jgi:hypothetical protein